jgi:hypothetical protein
MLAARGAARAGAGRGSTLRVLRNSVDDDDDDDGFILSLEENTIA